MNAQSRMARWTDTYFSGPDAVPFSFVYGGTAMQNALAGWKSARSEFSLPDGKTGLSLTFSDAATGLTVRCEAVIYPDFPAAEWTLYFKNEGSKDTPIISNIKNIDADPAIPGTGDYTLHRNIGARVQNIDFQPVRETLRKKQKFTLTAYEGKASNHDMPYFNIQRGGAGAIAVIGWPGQWSAAFMRDDADGLRMQGGIELTHFTLHPGEEIRTPLIALLFWDGERAEAQNMFRRWMLKYNVPRDAEGRVFRPQIFACSSHQYAEMINANEENQKQFVDAYADREIDLDYWWMDAGWYIQDGTWTRTGTWEVDRGRFPNGLKAITDRIHERGFKSIVWFEPERVTIKTWLYSEKQKWLLGKYPEDRTKLLNLGDPEAFAWTVEHFDGLLKSEGIDMYRQDFNVDPLPFWRANDAEDRQGLTEIKYLTGYLAYWDELLRRHPGMVIDNCAGGGKRLDLESLRRSVPLLRSDYIFEPEGQQGHHMGIAEWFPYHGTGMSYTLVFTDDINKDKYAFRSCAAPNIICCYDMRRDDIGFAELRKMHAELRRISEFYFSDFYALTDNNVSPEAWAAWQYNAPESGRGVVQAFKRENSPYALAKLKLHGLDATASYRFEYSNDDRASFEMTGADLMENGFELAFDKSPDSAVIFYGKV